MNSQQPEQTDRDHPTTATQTSMSIDPPLPIPGAEQSDNRGQIAQFGLILAIMVIGITFALAQVTLAPDVRTNTEYTHATAALADMEDLQINALAAASSDAEQGTVVKMGARYPNYVIFIHPPDPTGTIKTTEQETIALRNAEALHSETDDYLDGREITLQSRGLQYEAEYHEYSDAPRLRISPTNVLYAGFSDSQKLINKPSLVDGREIRLTAAAGNLYATKRSPSMMRVSPLSASKTTVRVTNQTAADPVTIQFPTALNETTWRTILAGQLDGDTSAASPRSDGDSQYVAEVSKSGGELTITFETGVTYNLQMAKIGYKTAEQASLPSGASPNVTYLTSVSDKDPVVVENNTVELTVEVRDAFNNPRSNVKVTASANRGNIERTEQFSGVDGTVTFEYEAPEIEADTAVKDSETYQVTTRLRGGSGEQVVVVFNVQVQNSYN